MAERNEQNRCFFYPIEQMNYARINNRNYKKKQFPQVYQNPNRNEIIIDFPGIDYSKSLENQSNQSLLISYLLMQNILKSAKKSKFMLILDANLLEQKISRILIFLQKFHSLFSQVNKQTFNKFIGSIEFIFTNRKYTKQKILQKISLCLNQTNQNQIFNKQLNITDKQKGICKQLIQKMKKSFIIIDFNAKVNQILGNNMYLQKIDLSQQKNKLLKYIFKEDQFLKPYIQKRTNQQFGFILSFVTYCAKLQIQQILNLSQKIKKQILEFCSNILIKSQWIHTHLLKIKIIQTTQAQNMITISHLIQMKKQFDRDRQKKNQDISTVLTVIKNFIKLFKLTINNHHILNQLQSMFESVLYEWKYFVNDLFPYDLNKKLIVQVQKVYPFFNEFEIKILQKINLSQSNLIKNFSKSNFSILNRYENILEQFYLSQLNHKNAEFYKKWMKLLTNILKIQCFIYIKQKEFIKALATIFICLHFIHSSSRRIKSNNFEIKKNVKKMQILQKIAKLSVLINRNNIFHIIKCFKYNLAEQITKEEENMILQQLFIWLAEYGCVVISQQFGNYLIKQNYGDNQRNKIFEILDKLNSENDQKVQSQRVIFNPLISDFAQYSYHLIAKIMNNP